MDLMSRFENRAKGNSDTKKVNGKFRMEYFTSIIRLSAIS